MVPSGMFRSCSSAADMVQGAGVVVPVGVTSGVGLIIVGVGGISSPPMALTITAILPVAIGFLPR